MIKVILLMYLGITALCLIAFLINNCLAVHKVYQNKHGNGKQLLGRKRIMVNLGAGLITSLIPIMHIKFLGELLNFSIMPYKMAVLMLSMGREEQTNKIMKDALEQLETRD